MPLESSEPDYDYDSSLTYIVLLFCAIGAGLTGESSSSDKEDISDSEDSSYLSCLMCPPGLAVI